MRAGKTTGRWWHISLPPLTHTHTVLSLYVHLSLSFIHTHFLSVSLSLSLALSLSLSHTHTHTHTHTISLSHTHAHTHAHTLWRVTWRPHTHSLSLSHTHTQSLSLSFRWQRGMALPGECIARGQGWGGHHLTDLIGLTGSKRLCSGTRCNPTHHASTLPTQHSPATQIESAIYSALGERCVGTRDLPVIHPPNPLSVSLLSLSLSFLSLSLSQMVEAKEALERELERERAEARHKTGSICSF